MSKLTFGQKATATPAAKPAAKTTASSAAPAKKTTTAKAAPTVEVEAEVVNTPAPRATAAPVKETTTALAKPSAPAVNGLEGELDASDFRLPRLNLVNGSSKLATEMDFPIGAFVVEKEVVVAEKDQTLTAVVLNLVKSYQQKLPYGESDELPLRFRTEEEVKENGGTTKWSEEAVEEGRFYQKRADLVVAILAPEGLDESELHRFPEELDGSRWGRFVFTVAGGGYQTLAVPAITAACGKLKNRGGLAAGLFEIKGVKKSGNGNTWYVPQARIIDIVTDEAQLAFFSNLVADSVPQDEMED